MVLFFPKFPRGAFPQTLQGVWAWIRFSLFWQIVSDAVAQYYHHFCIKDFLDCCLQFNSFIILPDFDWQKYERKEETDYYFFDRFHMTHSVNNSNFSCISETEISFHQPFICKNSTAKTFNFTPSNG